MQKQKKKPRAADFVSPALRNLSELDVKEMRDFLRLRLDRLLPAPSLYRLVRKKKRKKKSITFPCLSLPSFLGLLSLPFPSLRICFPSLLPQKRTRKENLSYLFVVCSSKCINFLNTTDAGQSCLRRYYRDHRTTCPLPLEIERSFMFPPDCFVPNQLDTTSLNSKRKDVRERCGRR